MWGGVEIKMYILYSLAFIYFGFVEIYLTYKFKVYTNTLFFNRVCFLQNCLYYSSGVRTVIPQIPH